MVTNILLKQSLEWIQNCLLQCHRCFCRHWVSLMRSCFQTTGNLPGDSDVAWNKTCKTWEASTVHEQGHVNEPECLQRVNTCEGKNFVFFRVAVLRTTSLLYKSLFSSLKCLVIFWSKLEGGVAEETFWFTICVSKNGDDKKKGLRGRSLWTENMLSLIAMDSVWAFLVL